MSLPLYIVRGGTDAGGIIITIGADGKIHIKRIPGWNPELLTDLVSAVDVIGRASSIKQKGLAEAVIKEVMPLVQDQLAQNVKEGGVVFVR